MIYDICKMKRKEEVSEHIMSENVLDKELKAGMKFLEVWADARTIEGFEFLDYKILKPKKSSPFRVRITHQEYRGKEFFEGGDQFKASNGQRLCSVVGPVWVADIAFVRGSATGADSDVLEFPTAESFLSFCEAVVEYNNACEAIGKKEATGEEIDYALQEKKIWEIFYLDSTPEEKIRKIKEALNDPSLSPFIMVTGD